MDQTLDVDLVESIFKKNETLNDGKNEFLEYDFDKKDFMHSVGFFGGSESGKTFLCKDILSRVRHVFPRVVLFSPTAPLNGEFQGIINNLLIVPMLTEEKFIEMYKAQEEISILYKKINSKEVLSEVFEVAATSSQKNMLNRIYSARDKLIDSFSSSSSSSSFSRREKGSERGSERGSEKGDESIVAQKVQQLNNKLDKVICKFMKSVILPVRHTLSLDEFSPAAQDCIKYLDLQPNTLWIFDDLMDECASMSKKTKSPASMLFLNLFTKARHIHLTHWHILQDDAPVPPKLRKNLRTSIFTRGDTANSYITRASNGISKIDQKFGLSMIDVLFQGDHKKMFYFKEKTKAEKFQYFTARNAGLFCTSSTIINNFCDSLI
jgi:hypothetical protein